LLVHDQEEITAGEAVAGMILNGLGFSDRPLTLTPQFFANKPLDLLFHEGVRAEMFNRFKLGRTLDEAYGYGCDLLLSELALSVCLQEGIDRRCHHLDTTSFSLTGTSVLKTPDGGNHWNDVTPPNFPVHPGLTGAFISQNEAWVVGVTEQGLFIVQHTNDGGTHWQRSQFSNGPITGTGGIGDPPHFLNAREGWLDVQRNYSMGAGTTTNDVFHTTDGGRTWQQINYSIQ